MIVFDLTTYVESMQGSVVDLSRSLQHIPLFCFLKIALPQYPCSSLSSLSLILPLPNLLQVFLVFLALMMLLIGNSVSVESSLENEAKMDQYLTTVNVFVSVFNLYQYTQCCIVFFDMFHITETSILVLVALSFSEWVVSAAELLRLTGIFFSFLLLRFC